MAIKLSKEKTSEYINSHIKWLKIGGILLVTLIACIVGYFVLETHTITITEDKIQEEINKKMPISYKKDLVLTSYVKSDFSKIDLKLLDSGLIANIDGNIEVHLIKSRFSNLNATIDTGIDFKKGTDNIQIFLKPNSIKFKEVNFKLDDDKDSPKVNEFVKNNLPYIENKIKDHLKTHPIYTYKSSDMKKSAIIMSIKEIKVKDGAIEIKFQLLSLVLMVTIGLIVVVGLIVIICTSPVIILEIFGGLLEAIGGTFI